ncbi:MAG: alkaline phosphatase family protein [Pseudomonadota bacterium]|nr:alkaline phosphatase family protein [Pseudomonadota bacterium]
MRRPASPSRREALVGAAATVAACTGPKGDTGGELPAPEAATIDTIVVLMMENRSFDHYLGALRLVDGRMDVDGLDAAMSNPGSAGEEHPVAPTAVDCPADPGHSWAASHDQFNEGANDGFVRGYETRCEPDLVGEVMGYLTRDQLPVTYALADAYTVCDAWFCSVMGPTWPNRFYGHAATSDGQKNNDFPSGGAFTFPTVWNKLDEAGIAWRYYYTDVPYIGLFAGHFRNETAALLEEFLSDAERGALPPVVWIDPGFSYNDDHPPHHPGLGQEMIALVYDALSRSPQWGRCLLVVLYDEHGGFHDHVAPPTTDDDLAADGFDQMGFRVPTLLVGPYVRPGVEHTTFDHTSWIKYVCERHGIDPWNARLRAANSIGVALDTDRMAISAAALPITLPVWDFDETTLGAECNYGGGPVQTETTDIERFVREFTPGLDGTAKVAERLAAIRARRRG